MGHDDRLGPGAEPLASLLDSPSSRRSLLKGGVGLAAALLSPGRLLASATDAGLLPGSTSDRVVVADGYSYDVIIRWGDPLFADAEALDAAAVARGSLLDMAPTIAERQFGYNNDAVHFFPLEGSSSRGIVCVNHEYTNEELFLPGLVRIETADPQQIADYVRRHPGVVPLTQAMHGVSILVVERDERGHWNHVVGTPYARRITGASSCEITGPARGHPLLRTAADRSGTRVLGTLNNCAGGETPWGTYLTAEENVDHYFGNGAALARADASVQQAHRRVPPRAASIHGWEHVDARFDLGREPTELLRFGWIVEIDPYDPAARPKKRTALGRCKHEGAATAMTRDGRLAVYTGDDDRFEYLYKFVTAGRVHPTDRAANRDLLDRGVLYVARFDSDGSGRWLPLVQGQGPLTAANGFATQADVVLRAREAADLLGATPMDRPEDVAPDAATGRVYVALTNNKDRAAAATRGEYNGRELDLGPNAANPQGPNPYGHVIEIEEADGDCGAEAFRWGLFLAGGESAAPSPFGSPDNLALDRAGNLWIVTDGTQPGGFNNGCYIVPTRGPERGRIRQVMSAPRGAEVCGCSFTPDGSTLLLSIQHPGEGGSLAAPTSQWPDGPGRVPRPSLIALELPQPGDRG
jgi:secreted PhoX family phosphatase